MNEEIKFQLTPQETDIVMRSLAEQPYKVVCGVISKMMEQANSLSYQNPAPVEPLVQAVVDAQPVAGAALPAIDAP